MRYLLDTHTLLFFVAGDPLLSMKARDLIQDPGHDILVSAASAWEVATKFRLGKLPGAALLAQNFVLTVRGLGFELLSITAEAAQKAGGWTLGHKDPFDRMLAAQAILEGTPLITNDTAMLQFGAALEW